MKKITNIPYSKTDFKFVQNHYDLHLSGTCIYNNKLHVFKTIEWDYYDEDENYENYNPTCDIYELTLKERIKYWYIQKKFEWMVGYHWSYSNKKRISNFYYRNPKWLYKKLFKIYFKTKKLK